ncbi:MAG: zinc metalloprotease HtpX [Firmicutes bacterium]|nr:zinc metalloprotease HtpX [Alicyclobacillaceae bacterium]MCL6496019.1 zinc metalloprotease HtpX [Bacillota bacterium]
MATRKPWYGRDMGLTVRMSVTMLLLAALYLAFLIFLFQAGVPLPTLVLIMGLLLLSQYYFSDQLVLWSTRARRVSPAQAPELYRIVERLAHLADVPIPALAIMPARMPNAFATGRDPKNAVIVVTQGLLDRLDERELEAVLAHELTHIKNRDAQIITIASFFAMLASFIVQQIFFVGFSLDEGRDRRDGAAGGIMLVWVGSLLVWAISYILIRALSRYREYAADRGSAILTGHPGYLASALLKIEGGMRRTPNTDLRSAEALNAFFIFPAISRDSLMELFSTHPSLEHRLAYLERLQEEMEK